MPILIALGMALLFAVVFGPQVWIRRVLARYGADRPDLPGTGAELARQVMEENISRMAGSQHGVRLEPAQLIERLQARQPDVVRLATLAAATTVVEPALLRRLHTACTA